MSEHHYKMCGLDNVYLLDGFKVQDAPYGEGITISYMDDLHKAICAALLLTKPLTTVERRFLDTEFEQDIWEAIPSDGKILCRLNPDDD